MGAGVGGTGVISMRLTYETPRDLLKSTKPTLNSDLIGTNYNLH